MEHLITDYVLHYGYLAVFVLMVLESACIPVPSEVTMLFGGALANGAFLASLGQDGEHLNFVLVALVGTFGNLVGSWIAWAVGYRGGRPLIERWGRYVFLRKDELDRAEVWFERHGQLAVLVSRLLPVVRTFISLPAGIAKMPFLRFSLYTVVGCLPWTFALTAVGYALGGQWGVVERYLRPVSYAVAALVVVAAVWWLGKRWLEQRRGSGGLSSEARAKAPGSRAEPSVAPRWDPGSGGLSSEAQTGEPEGEAEPSVSPPVNPASGRHERAARSTGDAGDAGDASSAGRPGDGRTAAPRR